MTSGSWRRRLPRLAAGLVIVVTELWLRPAFGQPASPCAGDCTGDGQVTVNEVVLLVNVALGSATVAQCAAGDTNRDGQITINEIILAVTTALGACPASAEVTIRVGSATGVAGGSVVLDTTLESTDLTAIATLNEIYFSALTPIAARPNGRPDCNPNPQLGKDLTAFSYLPPGCAVGRTCTGMRAIVLGGPSGSPNAPIPDGATLYTCTVTIAATASPGTPPLNCRPFDQPTADPYAYYTTADREDRPAACADGAISITP